LNICDVRANGCKKQGIFCKTEMLENNNNLRLLKTRRVYARLGSYFRMCFLDRKTDAASPSEGFQCKSCCLCPECSVALFLRSFLFIQLKNEWAFLPRTNLNQFIVSVEMAQFSAVHFCQCLRISENFRKLGSW
jgi:hypothetical protein